MKKRELEKLLKNNNINSTSYDLSGGLSDNKYCLLIVPNGICSVYYTEKGKKYDEKLFHTEDEACEYFYKLILEDEAVFLN